MTRLRMDAMVKAPAPEEEDRRRLCRERKVLIAERVKRACRGTSRCVAIAGDGSKS